MGNLGYEMGHTPSVRVVLRPFPAHAGCIDWDTLFAPAACLPRFVSVLLHAILGTCAALLLRPSYTFSASGGTA